MLVYNITDLESFENLNYWLYEIEKNAPKDVYKILVGNKCDIKNERKISIEQGKEFAQKYGMKFFETSAKNATNVTEGFCTMIKDIININCKKNDIINKKNNIKIDDSDNVENINNTCCNIQLY